MEKLSILISNLVQEGKWKPIRISNSVPSISHILFVDDCLFFIRAKSSQLRLVTQVMYDFGKALGLRLNLDKSRMMGSKCLSRTKMEKFATISSIPITLNIAKYLGFPMFTKRPTKHDFHNIFEHMTKHLSGWKGKLLNKSGRVTLARSVLSSISLYPMQTLWLPTSVCDLIDVRIRNFIWKGNSESRHAMHLVKWDVVSQPRSQGGLVSGEPDFVTQQCWEIWCGRSKNNPTSFGCSLLTTNTYKMFRFLTQGLERMAQLCGRRFENLLQF